MKAIHMLLFDLLVVAAGLVWLLTVDQPFLATGFQHPDVDAMRVGGRGAARIMTIFAPVVVLQAGSISVMTSLILLALMRGSKSGLIIALVKGISTLSIFVWIGIIFTYRDYLQTGEFDYVLGFPLPSALAVYAVWGVGLLLTLLYVVGFERFVYTADDRKGFEALLRDMENKKDDG